MLAETEDGLFKVECAEQLCDGLDRLSKGGIAAVLLDLFLPDSQGIETFEKLIAAAPDVPLLILIDLDNKSIAQQAVKRGAQDYLLNDHLDSDSLPHAVRNVIANKALEKALRVEKERAQVTLDSIGDAVISTDIPGNVTYLNPVAERMTGWPRQEALGRPLAEARAAMPGASGPGSTWTPALWTHQ
jgi:DNA-binding NarL/FixJ family response regulator